VKFYSHFRVIGCNSFENAGALSITGLSGSTRLRIIPIRGQYMLH
jgi:hypothetical protein